MNNGGLSTTRIASHTSCPVATSRAQVAYSASSGWKRKPLISVNRITAASAIIAGAVRLWKSILRAARTVVATLAASTNGLVRLCQRAFDTDCCIMAGEDAAGNFTERFDSG